MGYSIAIEGIDGAGKYTVCQELMKILKIFVNEVDIISFPQHGELSSTLVDGFLYKGLSFKSDNYYNQAVNESLLYSIDRMVTLNKCNEENMSYKDKYDKTNSILIFDRYTYSNLIHRCNNFESSELTNFARKLERLEFDEMNIIKPNIVFLLNINPNTAYKNIEQRGREKDENETMDNLIKSSKLIDQISDMIKPKSYVINVNSDINDSGMKKPEEIAMDMYNKLLEDKEFLKITFE